MLAVFVVGYGAIALHLWLRPSLAVLFASSAWVAFLALVTIAWWFWPWYVTWFVPLAALSPRRGVALVAVVFSLTAMLMYGTYYWNVYGDWHELQRGFERLNQADSEAVVRARSYHLGADPPRVTLLLQERMT